MTMRRDVRRNPDLAAYIRRIESHVGAFDKRLLEKIPTKEELNKKLAYKTVFFILLFPTAYFLTAMYTESLFLFLTLLFFWYTRRGDFRKAGLIGFLASLTRIQGAILFLPMLYIYLREKKFKAKSIRPDILLTLLIPAGIFTFLLYLYILTGNPFMQFDVQKEEWGRGLTFPLFSLSDAVIRAFTSTNIIEQFYYSFNFLIVTSFLILILFSFKQLPYEYGFYSLLSISMPLFTGSLFSMTRFVLVLFPAFMIIAKIDNENKTVSLFLKFIYIVFIILLVLFTIRHVNEDIYLI